MKKYVYIGGVLAVFVAGMVATKMFNQNSSVRGAQEFTTHPEGDADFVTFINQDRKNWDENANIISKGERGDFLNYTDETPEILQIYNNKEKTAKFLSIKNPGQYIKPGKCLVNTIPYDVLKETDARTYCFKRLFCGGELPSEDFYAVELCGIMVQD